MFIIQFDNLHEQLMIDALNLYAQIHLFNLFSIVKVLKKEYPNKKIDVQNMEFFEKVQSFFVINKNKDALKEFSDHLLVLKKNINKSTDQIILQKNDIGKLIRALDFYTRITIGQLWETTNILRMFFDHIINFQLKFIEEGIFKIAADTFEFPRYSSYGIYSQEVPNNSRIMYEIQQVLRHELWKIGDKPSYTVDSSPVFHMSNYHLIKCLPYNQIPV